jgi:CDP-2,3-bis-(O-geranylgeranyl)-sn-glycerol synthase
MVDCMSVVLLIAKALEFIFPAYCANAVPVLAGGGPKMDFGKNFVDGKRIFGNNKTFRGFFFGWAIGLMVGLADWAVFGFPIVLAVLTPLGALLGDLTGAFIKRRLDIAPGGLLPVVDQIDFVVGAIVFSLPFLFLMNGALWVNWQIALIALIITPPIHLLTNYGAYKLKLKRHPW